MPDSIAIGDPLDRCYTPQALADAIVHVLDTAPPAFVLEPSVGGGAFVRAVRKRWGDGPHIDGIDIDPTADGLRLCDASIVGPAQDLAGADPTMKYDLIIGNPPFSEALEHVSRFVKRCPRVVMILPLAYLGVQEWDELLTTRPPSRIYRIVGRPWPDRIRETAVYEWNRDRPPCTFMTRLRGWP
jgi:hypothetical protein